MTRFNATIDELPQILDWVYVQLQNTGIKSVRRLELAIEEVVVNVIVHGYQNHGGLLDLDIQRYEDGRVEVKISDFAPPFNPLELVQVDQASMTLETKPIGKMGLILISANVDGARYKRRPDGNTLTLWITDSSQKL